MAVATALDKITFNPEPIQGSGWRMVESQHDNATLAITRSLTEQSRLEELLEQSKPAYPADVGDTSSARLHYLLRTPFRYPPLAYGSRFGDRFSPSLFYASLTVDGMLAESAYYRAVFWDDYEDKAEGDIITGHTAFSFRYKTTLGLRLHEGSFKRHQAVLTHPANYGPTQALGARMREAGIIAFEYISARSQIPAINLALFTHKAFTVRKPVETGEWSCRLGGELIEFREHHSGRVESYRHDVFYVDGVLPRPAG
ncbi:MAG: RES family NAD+ phosphorylase [Gammaproteobacteria bacterium]|nr:RES family NAD+ phosphorylase [Gammaproteobacteria bacterium]